jgi:hypothetical protein
MKFDVVAVDDRGDRADCFSVLARQEPGGFGVVKKRVLLFIQMKCYIVFERRHPVGIVLVHFSGKADDFVPAGRAVDFFDVHESPTN